MYRQKAMKQSLLMVLQVAVVEVVLLMANPLAMALPTSVL
jgi:hypothetical protein